MLINVPLFSLTEIAADDLQQNQKNHEDQKCILFLSLHTSVFFIVKKFNELYRKEVNFISLGYKPQKYKLTVETLTEP